MKSLSKIALGIKPSATLAITDLANRMRKDGYDIISFGAGEPDFNTPDHIKAAAIEAVNSNKSYYTTATGIFELRQAICDRLYNLGGLTYKPSQICVSSGAKHVIFLSLMAIINPGDEVILPAPYWVTYYEAIKMAGGVPVVINTDEEHFFKISPEMLQNAITDKTKCLIICNPSNPTGALYEEDELKGLAKVIVDNDIYVIDDEIYCQLTYEGEYKSIAALGDEICKRTLIIDGVSKTFAMTGWRIGYLAANEEISKVVAGYISHSTGNPSNIAQYAALKAYTSDQTSTAAMKEAFNERRKYFVSRVAELPYVSCLEPKGAFYIFMNIKQLFGKTAYGKKIESCTDFSELLLKNKLVATVPGIAFGAEGYVRWSYATSMDNIVKGLDRLEEFLNEIE